MTERPDKGTPEERRWGLVTLLIRAETKARDIDPALADKIAALHAEVGARIDEHCAKYMPADAGEETEET